MSVWGSSGRFDFQDLDALSPENVPAGTKGRSMQSKQQHSKTFEGSHLVPVASRHAQPSNEGAQAGAQKNGLNDSQGGFRPSTEYIITPETFENTAGLTPDQVRYEIVLRLHESCYARIYSFLRRSVPADVADDLAQETFLRLLAHKKIERMSISISYLFRIAQNLLRRRYNRLLRSQQHLHDQLKRQRAGEHRYPVLNSDTFEIDSDQLDRAIGQLSPKEREVVKLIVCQGLSYSAAAKVMGVPVSTVNNWKYRALSRLREFICTNHGVVFDAPNDNQSGNDRAHLRGDSPGGLGQQGSSSRESALPHQIEIQVGTNDSCFGARVAG
jgi:RNA polymerase sigma-70 factor (ECF subfamily)